MSDKPRCKYTKADGTQCKKSAKDGTDYCWLHQGGKVSKKAVKKLQPAKKGSQNGNFVHGMCSNVLKVMCSDRCFMYEECEYKQDNPEGVAANGGICFFEIDTEDSINEATLYQIEGIKHLTAKMMKILEARINRGIRFELATGGFLSEPDIVNMIRTLSNLLFNMTNIYEQEELGDLKDELMKLQEMYRTALEKMGGT